MAAFIGTWEEASTENLGAFIDVFNVPAELKKMMMESKEVIDVTIDGATYNYVITRAGKENKVTLKVGEVTEYKNPAGMDMKGIIKSAGDTKVVEEHFLGDLKTDCTREIIKDQLCITLTTKGVTTKLFYNKK